MGQSKAADCVARNHALGGGYGTTGHKPANKQGHYFWGRFRASEHQAADNLAWLRRIIDENITFWRMAPVERAGPSDATMGIFANVSPNFRALAWPGHEYVLGTNGAGAGVQVNLPAGTWRVTRYDAVSQQGEIVKSDASGRLTLDVADSRAVLFHFRKVN